MSIEQQQQQPVYGYPNALTTQQQQPIQQHHSTNGSFASVFIVLAVIVVISVVACFLGRLCSKRMKGHSSSKTKHGHESGFDHKKNKKNNSTKEKDKDIEFGFEMSRPVRVKDKDIEFGFDKKVPSGKVAPGCYKNGDIHQQGVRGFQSFKNGEFGYKSGDGKHNMPPNYGREF